MTKPLLLVATTVPWTIYEVPTSVMSEMFPGERIVYVAEDTALASEPT